MRFDPIIGATTPHDWQKCAFELPTQLPHSTTIVLLAAIEFACLDLLGQKWGVPVSEILGGDRTKPRSR